MKYMNFKSKKLISLLMAICLLITCFGDINFGSFHNHNVKHASASSHVHTSACYNGSKHTHTGQTGACYKTVSHYHGSSCYSSHVCGGTYVYQYTERITEYKCNSCGNYSYSLGYCSCGGSKSLSNSYEIERYSCSNCGRSNTSSGSCSAVISSLTCGQSEGTSYILSCTKNTSDYYDSSDNIVGATCNSVVTSISATSPTVTTYMNESVNTSGMVVTASYLDGHSADISDYSITADTSSSGIKTATVTYNGYVDTASTIGSKTTTVSINVIPKTNTCNAGRGHADYQLNADGSDGGCPICNDINSMYNTAQGYYDNLVKSTNSLKTLKTNLTSFKTELEASLNLVIIDSDRMNIEGHISSVSKNLETVEGFISNADKFVSNANNNLAEISSSKTTTVARAKELADEILGWANTVSTYKITSVSFKDDADNDKNDLTDINNKAEEIEKNKNTTLTIKGEIDTFISQLEKNNNTLLYVINTLNDYKNIVIISSDLGVINSYQDKINEYIEKNNEFINYAKEVVDKANTYIAYMEDSTDKSVEEVELLVSEMQSLKVNVADNVSSSNSNVTDANNKMIDAYKFVQKANDIEYCKYLLDNMKLQLNKSKDDFSNNRVVEEDYQSIINEILTVKEKAIASEKITIQDKADEVSNILTEAYSNEDEVNSNHSNMEQNINSVLDIVSLLDFMDYIKVAENKVSVDSFKILNDQTNITATGFFASITNCYERACAIRDWVLAQNYHQQKQDVEDKSIVINDKFNYVNDLLLDLAVCKSNADNVLDEIAKLKENISEIKDSGILDLYLENANKIINDSNSEYITSCDYGTDIQNEINKVNSYIQTLETYVSTIDNNINLAVTTEDKSVFTSTMAEIDEIILLATQLVDDSNLCKENIDTLYNNIIIQKQKVLDLKNVMQEYHDDYVYANKVMDTLTANIADLRNKYKECLELDDIVVELYNNNSSLKDLKADFDNSLMNFEDLFIVYKTYVKKFNSLSTHGEVVTFDNEVTDTYNKLIDLYNSVKNAFANFKNTSDVIDNNVETVKVNQATISELIQQAKDKLDTIKNIIAENHYGNEELNNIINDLEDYITSLESIQSELTNIGVSDSISLDESKLISQKSNDLLVNSNNIYQNFLNDEMKGYAIIEYLKAKDDCSNTLSGNVKKINEIIASANDILSSVINAKKSEYNEEYISRLNKLQLSIEDKIIELNTILESAKNLIPKVEDCKTADDFDSLLSESTSLVENAQTILDNIKLIVKDANDIIKDAEKDKEKIDDIKNSSKVNEDNINNIIKDAENILTDATEKESQLTDSKDKEIAKDILELIKENVDDLYNIKKEIEDINKELESTTNLDKADELINKGNELISEANKILDNIKDSYDMINDLLENQKQRENNKSENPITDIELPTDKVLDILGNYFDLSYFSYDSNTGKLYYNKRILTPNEESYVKLFLNEKWSKSIIFTECKEYFNFIFYLKDKDNKTYRIILKDFVVDYNAPISEISYSDFTDTKDVASKQNISVTNLCLNNSIVELKVLFSSNVNILPYVDFGVSGKKTLLYQISSNGIIKDDKWIVLKNKNIPVNKEFKGNIIIKAVDNANNVSIIKLNNIVDNKKPTINIANNSFYKSKTVKFSDTNGIKSAIISFNGGKYKTIKNGTKFTKAGKYILKITDTFGNMKNVTFTIKK